MSKDPAFLFYTADFLVGTMTMSYEQKGKYIQLLCMQHQSGRMTEEEMLMICGNYDHRIFSKFEQDENGFYYNERLEAETEKRSRYTESRLRNGMKGGRPKKEKAEREKDDWQEMIDFFGNKCIKCGVVCDGRPTKDHIVPKSWGGEDNITNWQPLCRECNSSKCADHSTDYRYSFYEKIPENLRKKWFIKNHSKTICKAYENHTENENVIVIKNVFEYWNYNNIIKHKELTEEISKSIDKALKTYTEEEIKCYIDRYAEVLKDENYFFSYKWTLAQFLTRKDGISSFTDEGDKWVNYQAEKKPQEYDEEDRKQELSKKWNIGNWV